ncbi:hypothetical protein B0H15DRAFT_298917 [Mycena belliarum]|uniref:Uncharacterized protein n=1 Tax=Mycena belliarum TaxID=1033014 RepID=A0AAD6U7R2_9AGAR|nr:hypothetical protein B0H15DRAFT_298917 [Mycena belliae]
MMARRFHSVLGTAYPFRQAGRGWRAAAISGVHRLAWHLQNRDGAVGLLVTLFEWRLSVVLFEVLLRLLSAAIGRDSAGIHLSPTPAHRDPCRTPIDGPARSLRRLGCGRRLTPRCRRTAFRGNSCFVKILNTFTPRMALSSVTHPSRIVYCADSQP